LPSWLPAELGFAGPRPRGRAWCSGPDRRSMPLEAAGPQHAADFSYYLLQAQAFKAQAIANTERTRLPQSNKSMRSGSQMRPEILFVSTDSSGQFTHPGYDAYFRSWRCVGTMPWKHVADLCHLTLRLLSSGVEFGAVHLAGGILKGPDVRIQKFLCVVAGDGDDLAVAEVEAKWIEVAIEESAFTLVDQIERLGLVRFQSGDRLIEHGPGLLRRAKLLRERGG